MPYGMPETRSVLCDWHDVYEAARDANHRSMCIKSAKIKNTHTQTYATDCMRLTCRVSDTIC